MKRHPNTQVSQVLTVCSALGKGGGDRVVSAPRFLGMRSWRTEKKSEALGCLGHVECGEGGLMDTEQVRLHRVTSQTSAERPGWN